MFSPLHSATSEKQYKKVPLQSIQSLRKYDVLRAPIINYFLKSAAAIILRFRLCSVSYTALQTKNNVRIVSAINPVTMENTDDSRFYNRTVGKPCGIALPQIDTLGCQQKEMKRK